MPTPKNSDKKTPRQHFKLIALIFLVIVILLPATYAAYGQASPVIRHNITIGGTPVEGLTQKQALEKITNTVKPLETKNILLKIEDTAYPISVTAIELSYSSQQAVDTAWAIGRTGTPLQRIFESVTLPFLRHDVPLQPNFNETKLRNEIAALADRINTPLRDIHLLFNNQDVSIATDTQEGSAFDQSEAFNAVKHILTERRSTTSIIPLKVLKPSVTLDNAELARTQAERIIAVPLKITADHQTFTVLPNQLSSWIVSTSDGPHLRLDFDTVAISAYVTTIAASLDAEPQAPSVTVIDGKVTNFTEPRTGKRLDQEAAIRDIIAALSDRRDNAGAGSQVTFMVEVAKPPILDESAQSLGITELIGVASTRLTGSPKNRISNIKNGVKFLTGILIKPGEEFSTLKALGTVDNTTGYLPELVIKENRTIPEYGGGLCQVSTTLFRAALNSGLPITSRQNHSYRVPYYEKDGEGNYIGPGLDATIYQPAPDFKFLNDTGSTILIQGIVVGDKITFSLYGTKDGRSSYVDGPHKLSDTPAGEPIYAETDTLKPGETKQLEKAHNGGSAIATYTVTYADGTVKTQVFKSIYRNWPARYLIGIDPNKPKTEGTPTSTPDITTLPAL